MIFITFCRHTYDCWSQDLQNGCDTQGNFTTYYAGNCTDNQAYCTQHGFMGGFDKDSEKCLNYTGSNSNIEIGGIKTN